MENYNHSMLIYKYFRLRIQIFSPEQPYAILNMFLMFKTISWISIFHFIDIIQLKIDVF